MKQERANWDGGAGREKKCGEERLAGNKRKYLRGIHSPLKRERSYMYHVAPEEKGPERTGLEP